MKHIAKEFLKFCESKDYGMKVDEFERTYNWRKAWKQILEIDEGNVRITDQTGNWLADIYIMADGINSCAPDETIVDCYAEKDFQDIIDKICAD